MFGRSSNGFFNRVVGIFTCDASFRALSSTTTYISDHANVGDCKYLTRMTAHITHRQEKRRKPVRRANKWIESCIPSGVAPGNTVCAEPGHGGDSGISGVRVRREGQLGFKIALFIYVLTRCHTLLGFIEPVHQRMMADQTSGME